MSTERQVTYQYPSQSPRHGVLSIPLDKKGVCEAYLLAIPLGFLGAHHFYLRRPGFGLLYFFTLGLFGFGWIIDWFRIPCLVRDANNRIQLEAGPSPFPYVPKKRLDDAYILSFPLGFLGFHHYYLERYGWGVAYTFTFGLFGVGWLIDLCRMPCLVSSVNDDIKRRVQNEGYMKPLKSTCDAYILGLPLGFLGFHHFYLDRIGFGLVYLFTFGLLGVGWVVDVLRMPCLVRDVNRRILRPDPRKSLCDAYVLWFPFGIFGFHHFYLNRGGWGALYFFTFGIFGIGWLVDFCRLPYIVKEVNKEIVEKQYFVHASHTEVDRSVTVREDYAYPRQQHPHPYPQQPGPYQQQPGPYPQQYPQHPGPYPQQPGPYAQQPGNYGSVASGFQGYQQAPTQYQQPHMPTPQAPPPPQPGCEQMPAPPPYTEYPAAGHSSQDGGAAAESSSTPSQTYGVKQDLNDRQGQGDSSSRQPSAPPSTPPKDSTY